MDVLSSAGTPVRHRTHLAPLLVVVAALLGACSDSGSPSADPPGSTATSTSSSAPTTTTTSPYAPGWSAVHADAANSDYTAVEGSADLDLAWDRRFQGDTRIGDLDWTINLGPTSDQDGQLYLTSTVPGCHLQAIAIATGDTAWCAEDLASSAVVSSPLIDAEGRIYVADGVAMYSFDRDGEVLWSHPIVGVPLSAQFSPAGHVVFVTHVGVVYILDRVDGRPVIDPVELVPDPVWDASQRLWACAVGTDRCPSANTPAVDLSTGRMYVTWWEPGAEQAGVRAMQIVDGPEPAVVDVWSNDSLPGGSASSPALSADGTRVYVTDNVDSIHALDAETGEVIWSHPIGIAAGGSLSVSPSGVIMAPGGALQAIADDGDHARLMWRDEDLQARGIATQADGDIVYATVVRDAGALDLVVVDARTGRVLDREPIEGVTRFNVGITVSPDGTVLVPTIVGSLTAFRPIP